MSTKKTQVPSIRSSTAEYLTFVAGSGTSDVNAIYADENIWLSQKMMALLYDVNVRTVSEHLQKIFTDNELQESAVIRKIRITATDGKNYETQHYNLSAMDDERLKSGGTILTKQYFEEKLQRIREIRLSGRKFYQKIANTYATSIDYDVTAQSTRRFFSMVQDQLYESDFDRMINGIDATGGEA